MAIAFLAVVTLTGSLGFWYLYYGIECFMNGVFTRPGKSSLYMMLASVGEEFMWNMPGGYEKKMKLCHGDVELVKTLPGPIHFVILHILIPFGPTVLVLSLPR